MKFILQLDIVTSETSAIVNKAKSEPVNLNPSMVTLFALIIKLTPSNTASLVVNLIDFPMVI